MATLEIRNLTKRFGGLVAVNNMSFDIGKGEIVGMLGPNGSGKTTLLNLISGATPLSGGSVKLDGREISRIPAYKISRFGVARTFQLVRGLPSLSATENVIASLAFGPDKLWGKAAVSEAEAMLNLVGLNDRGADSVASFTYIDQKRLELARALASKPRLLLLDEWLAGLNPTELQTGIELIRSLEHAQTSIIIVEHIMEAVRALCPRCIVMNAGEKIADDATEIVLEDPDVIEAYLGRADA